MSSASRALCWPRRAALSRSGGSTSSSSSSSLCSRCCSSSASSRRSRSNSASTFCRWLSTIFCRGRLEGSGPVLPLPHAPPHPQQGFPAGCGTLIPLREQHEAQDHCVPPQRLRGQPLPTRDLRHWATCLPQGTGLLSLGLEQQCVLHLLPQVLQGLLQLPLRDSETRVTSGPYSSQRSTVAEPRSAGRNHSPGHDMQTTSKEPARVTAQNPRPLACISSPNLPRIPAPILLQDCPGLSGGSWPAQLHLDFQLDPGLRGGAFRSQHPRACRMPGTALGRGRGR